MKETRKYTTVKEKEKNEFKELKQKQAHLEVFLDIEYGEQGEIL